MKTPKEIIKDMISEEYRQGYIKPYSCPKCGADFPTYKLLQVHIVGHKEYAGG